MRGDRGMLAYTGQNTFYWFYPYLFSILSFLLTLVPSDGFAATFPDKRGRLTICMLLFLLILASFVSSLRRHLSQGKASHSLLQRRVATRKVVRLLPVVRGQLTFLILSFCNKHVGTAFCMNHFHILFFPYKTTNSFFLSRQLPSHPEGSAEPARR